MEGLRPGRGCSPDAGSGELEVIGRTQEGRREAPSKRPDHGWIRSSGSTPPTGETGIRHEFELRRGLTGGGNGAKQDPSRFCFARRTQEPSFHRFRDSRAAARGILVGRCSQTNVELTRRAFQAYNDRDLDAVLVGLDEDVEAFPRLAAVEGGYRGHEGIRRWWAQLLDAFPDFHVEILEVRDLGGFVVLALRLRGRGAESNTPIDAAVWHVNQFRDGKVIGWRVYTSEREALEVAGAAE